MNTLSRKLAGAGAAVLLGATLAGCVMVPTRHGYVAVAPPAPRVEVVGVAPGPGYFWVGGHWGWYGGRHVWRDGYWEQRRPGYRWEPQRWDRDNDGYRDKPGRWQPQ
jgi:WXXGXW repeat (2 copies)